MVFSGIGDLARHYGMQRHISGLNREMSRLTEELSTGRHADLTKHLSGRHDQLAHVEHALALLQGYGVARAEAAGDLAAMQNALQRVQMLGETLNHAALQASDNAAALDNLAEQAHGNLQDMIGALNAGHAGRALFAGQAVDESPLAGAGTLLSDLGDALDGAQGREAVIRVLDDYFGRPGGGFTANIYQGSHMDLAPYELGAGEAVSAALRADDPALRDLLKHTALAALVTDERLDLAPAARHELARHAVDQMIPAQGRLTQIRARLGFAEARLEQAASRMAAETTSLTLLRNNLTAVDPAETATELQAAQSQLEMLYAVTARSARLSLVNFLS